MLYIMRHGETALNRTMALQGRSDKPLNEQGLLQAEEAGTWFRKQGIVFDRVYSSPLSRAIDTARLAVGKEFLILTDERLIEMDYGPYEGLDLSSPPKEITEFFRDFVHVPAPAGMEQLWEVKARMGDFLEEHLKEAEKGNLLLSTHAVAMKGALEYLTPGSNGSYWSKHIGNCAVYSAGIADGVWQAPVQVR